jgi:hypothetical protein
VKWTVFAALALLVIIGRTVAIRWVDGPATHVNGAIVESGTDVGFGAAMPPAVRSNTRSVRVKANMVYLLVHCNDVAACDGYAALESKRSGALLGVRDYHLHAGADTRIRIPFRTGTRERHVVLNWQQDESGWTGGSYDLTLRR